MYFCSNRRTGCDRGTRPRFPASTRSISLIDRQRVFPDFAGSRRPLFARQHPIQADVSALLGDGCRPGVREDFHLMEKRNLSFQLSSRGIAPRECRGRRPSSATNSSPPIRIGLLLLQLSAKQRSPNLSRKAFSDQDIAQVREARLLRPSLILEPCPSSSPNRPQGSATCLGFEESIFFFEQEVDASPPFFLDLDEPLCK